MLKKVLRIHTCLDFSSSLFFFIFLNFFNRKIRLEGFPAQSCAGYFVEKIGGSCLSLMELVGRNWNSLRLHIICSLLLHAGTCSKTINFPDHYGLNEQFTVSELPPSCVDLIDVWPTPNTFLKPFRVDNLFSDYSIQLWFSRPVEVPLNPFVSVSVSNTKILNLLPYYTSYFGGSERNLLVFFRIPNGLKFVRLVNFIMFYY